MNTKKDVHLDEASLLSSVIDESDMPASVQEHLAACPRCLAEKEQLQERLARLSQAARVFVPHHGKRVALPAREAPKPGGWTWKGWGFRGALVAAAASVVIIIWATVFRTSFDTRMAGLNQEMLDDDKLMSEVCRLEDDPLLQLYSVISDEQDSNADDDFMEFIVPAPDDTPLGFKQWERYTKC